MTGRLVVIGDVLLDRDVLGVVQRLCPDAPAPVLDQHTQHERAGGAGLAATLAAGDGRSVHLVTAIGTDRAGDRVRSLLAEAGVGLTELPGAAATAEKIRMIADGRVLIRLDRGGGRTRRSNASCVDATNGPGSLSTRLRDVLASAEAVLVSDYGQGITRMHLVRDALIRITARCPVVWDPHPRGSVPVPGVRLVTPNGAELVGTVDAAGLAADPDQPPHHLTDPELSTVADHADRVRRYWGCGAVAVTLGSRGALLLRAGTGPVLIQPPLPARGDTCGAGDRFASATAGALADGSRIGQAVQAGVALATDFVADNVAGLSTRTGRSA